MASESDKDVNADAPDRPATPPPLEAMAVYSADGQADDATGGDSAAEALRARQADAGETDDGMPHGPA